MKILGVVHIKSGLQELVSISELFLVSLSSRLGGQIEAVEECFGIL